MGGLSSTHGGGFPRIPVDLKAYARTLALWRDRLQRWRHGARGGATSDPETSGDLFAPARIRVVAQWLPSDPQAQQFLYETLALTQWPRNQRERTLGRMGKQLIPHLVFAISLPPPGRPPRARDLQKARAHVRARRPAMLRAIQATFRETRDLEARPERQAWVRTFIRRHLPQLTSADLSVHARRLASQRPVDGVNWILSRQLMIKPALVQTLASTNARRP